MRGIDVQFAITKVSKYATSESGDTIEMIERPFGGISFVMADGQRSGRSAKAISNVVVRKAIQLLAEGVRDGAAARAAHDYLYTYRQGKVSATLNILSVDITTKTFVISRNNPAPVMVFSEERGLYLLDEPSKNVGTTRHVKPVITELPIVPNSLIVIFTDGLRNAGGYMEGEGFDPIVAMQKMCDNGLRDPHVIADNLLAQAVAADNGRPRDDITVLVTAVLSNATDDVRRMSVRLPL